MKEERFKRIVTLSFSFFLLVAFFNGCCSCSKRMSDEDFKKITMGYSMEIIPYGLSAATGKISQSEYEDKAEEILEKHCQKYGYSIGDFKCKAKELKDNVDERIKDALKN